MNIQVVFEKVDTKIYTFDVEIDPEAVKKWAIDTYGLPDLEGNVDDEDNDETFLEAIDNPVIDSITRHEEKPDDWWKDHISEYLSEQDADLLHSDNCHDHSQYDLESEECRVVAHRFDENETVVD